MSSASADTTGRPTLGTVLGRVAGPRHKLKRRAIEASGWVMGSQVVSRVMRLGSHLVLARLLFPEAFGLMVPVYMLKDGVQMFSDIGLRQSLIQNDRADEPSFYNTAWTLQAIRGVLIWLAVCVLAAGLWGVQRAEVLPAESTFGEPILLGLVPFVGLSAVCGGLNSTRLATLNRELMMGRLTAFNIANQVLIIGVTLVWALLWPSVWALAGGMVIGSATSALASHFVFGPPINRFTWDRRSAKELWRFGRWLQASSIVTYFARTAERWVLATVMASGGLGLFAVASKLPGLIKKLLGDGIARRVLFPVYSKLAKRDTQRYRAGMFKARGALALASLPALWAMAIFGDLAIELLYDARYLQAGWMVQVLAAGTVGSVICATAQQTMMAYGNSHHHFGFTSAKLALKLGCLAVGAYWGGVSGLIVGVAAAEVLTYLPLAWVLRRYGVWTPGLDLGAFAASALVIGIGWWLR